MDGCMWADAHAYLAWCIQMAIKLLMGSGVQKIFHGGGNAMEQKLGQKYTKEMSLITVNEHITKRFPNKHIPCYIVHTYIIDYISVWFYAQNNTMCPYRAKDTVYLGQRFD